MTYQALIVGISKNVSGAPRVEIANAPISPNVIALAPASGHTANS